MHHSRSDRHRVSGVGVVTLDSVCVKESQCNLVDLTSSWERQNRVYVHFKSVTGSPKPRSLNVTKVKKEEKPSRINLAKIFGIF